MCKIYKVFYFASFEFDHRRCHDLDLASMTSLPKIAVIGHYFIKRLARDDRDRRITHLSTEVA